MAEKSLAVLLGKAPDAVRLFARKQSRFEIGAQRARGQAGHRRQLIERIHGITFLLMDSACAFRSFIIPYSRTLFNGKDGAFFIAPIWAATVRIVPDALSVHIA